MQNLHVGNYVNYIIGLTYLYIKNHGQYNNSN